MSEQSKYWAIPSQRYADTIYKYVMISITEISFRIKTAWKIPTHADVLEFYYIFNNKTLYKYQISAEKLVEIDQPSQ